MAEFGWGGLLAAAGAIIGSFLATLVIRWPQERSVVHGRSQCDGCGAALHARDLVPLFSALAAGGRCRACRQPIDPRHWQIELGCLAIGGIAGLTIGSPVAIAGAAFGWLLLALAALDVSAFWLPDRLTGTLAAGGLATGLLGIAPPLWERLAGGFGGFAALWLIAAAYERLRGREGMGGGDPKLLGAIGLWLGWRMLPAVLLLAAIAGLGLVLLGMLAGRKASLADKVPFGALLAIAAYPAWLFLLGTTP